jgi:hypothetical protein
VLAEELARVLFVFPHLHVHITGDLDERPAAQAADENQFVLIVGTFRNHL